MTNNLIQVLLIDDDPDDVLLILEFLAEAGAANIKMANTDRLSNGLKRIAEQEFDVILIDLNLPDSRGLETLKAITEAKPMLPVVVLSCPVDDSTTIEAIKQGAQDFLVKGKISGQVITRVIRYAIERKQIESVLHGSEEKYRNLIECAPYTLFIPSRINAVESFITRE